MSQTRDVSRFQLRVPESWVELDIWRATHTAEVPRIVDARLADTPELTRYRGPIIKALRDTAREAERHGALYCAGMLDPVEDAGMIAASAMVFFTEADADPAENTPERIAAQITATAPRDGVPHWRHVELVDLPAGRAVRVQGIEAVDVGTQPTDCVVMQTLIPVPDETGVLNVVLTSPQVALADSMLDLFDAISSTLAWATDPTVETTT